MPQSNNGSTINDDLTLVSGGAISTSSSDGFDLAEYAGQAAEMYSPTNPTDPLGFDNPISISVGDEVADSISERLPDSSREGILTGKSKDESINYAARSLTEFGSNVEDASRAFAIIGLSSLMELSRGIYNTGMDIAAWSSEKLGYGRPKWADEKTRKPFPTNREIADFYKLGQAYDEHANAYDVAGSIGAAINVGGLGAGLFTKGSKLYTTMLSMGVSPKVISWAFADTAGVSQGVKGVVDAASKLSAKGVKPHDIARLGKELKRVGWNSLKQSAKLTAAGEASTAALLYSNDILYEPSKSLNQKLMEYGGLPLALGSFGAVADFATMRKAMNRGAKLASEVNSKALAQRFKTSAESEVAYQGIGMAPTLASQSSDLATLYSYEIDGLKSLQKTAINDLANNAESVASPSEIAGAFSDEISTIQNKRLGVLGNLVSKSATSDQKAYAVGLLNYHLDSKPNLVFGVDNVTLVPKSNNQLDKLTGNQLSRKAKLEAKIANARKPEAKAKYEEAYEKIKEQTFSVLKPNGDVIPAANYHVSFRDDPENLKLIKSTSKNFGGTGKKLRSTSVKVVDEDYVVHNLEADISGKLLHGRGANVPHSNVIDYQVADAGWAVLQKELDGIEKYFDKSLADSKVKAKIHLPTATFQQLDYLDEAYRRLGETKFTKFFDVEIDDNSKELVAKVFGKRDSYSLGEVIQARSLVDKIVNIQFMATQAAKKTAKSKFDRYPIDSVFEEVFNLKPKNGSVADVVSAACDDWTSYSKVAEMVTLGDRLNYKGQVPLLLRSTKEIDITDKVNKLVFENLSATNANRRSILLGLNAEPLPDGSSAPRLLVNDFADDLYSNPAFDQASRVDEIAFGTDRLGKAGKYLLQNTFRTAENLTLTAMGQLNSEVSLKAAKRINAKIKPFGESLTSVVSDPAKATEFNSYVHQMRSGWFVAEDGLERLPDGRYALKLDASKSSTNTKIMARQNLLTSSNAELGDYVPNPFNLNEPLTFSEETANAIQEAYRLSDDLWENQRVLNTAMGKGNVPFRPYHIPAKDLTNKFVKVVTSLDGTPITYVSGNTAKQASELAAKEQKLIAQPTKVAELDSIRLHNELLNSDAEWSDMSDFSDMVNQYFSKNKSMTERTSMGAVVDVGQTAIKEVVDSFNNAYQRLARRTRRAVFQGQLDHAFSQLKAMNSNSLGYDQLQNYVNNSLGLSTHLDPKSAIGKAYNLFDSAIQTGQRAISDLSYMVADKYKSAKLDELATGEFKPRTIDKLFTDGKELKRIFKFSEDPVTDALDYLKRSNPKANLGTPKSAMGTVSRLLSLSMLRLANLGFAMTNVISLPATLPSVLRALGKRNGESISEHQARIGALGMDVKVNGDYDYFTQVDLFGTTVDTVNWMFSKDFKEVNRRATELGYFDTSASLMNEVFVDPTMSKTAKIAGKAVDVLSFFSDKSEELSRSIPFFMGYRIAEKSGVLSTDASRFAFAKRFMDDVVGNYQAIERPLTHSQGLGIPMSLFTTYTQNYGQRLFDYIENRDLRALAVQAFAQSAVFGTNSLTGSQLVENYFNPVEKGEDFYTAVQKEFGDATARTVLYGPLSNYTGLDFSSKGSVSTIRLPVVPSLSELPGVSATQNIIDGLGEMIKSAKTETGLTTNRLAEIWQTRLPSPFAKSAIDLALGYTTNRNGELVVGDTRSSLNLLANLASMRTLDETETAKQLYRNSQREMRQASALDAVRKNIRATARELNYNGITGADSRMESIIIDYLNAGGKPDNALDYLRNQIKTGLLTKSDAEIKSLIGKKDSASLKRALSLLSLTKESSSDNEYDGEEVVNPLIPEVTPDMEFFGMPTE